MKEYTLQCTEYYVVNGIVRAKQHKVKAKTLKEMKKTILAVATDTRWVPHTIERRGTDGTLIQKYDIGEYVSNSTAYSILHGLAVTIGYIDDGWEREQMAMETMNIIGNYESVLTEGDIGKLVKIIREGEKI